MQIKPRSIALTCIATGALTAVSPLAVAQTPTAHVYLDLATHASDIPGMGAAGAFASGGIGGGLANIFGGGRSGGGNVFGGTRAGFSPGKYMDVSVFTRANSGLTAATQALPAGFGLGDTLNLITPMSKLDPVTRDEDPIEPIYERPKGKMKLYWGCGDSIRSGQPRVLDLANASVADMQRFFGTARTSTTRGARLANGHPSWPHKDDDRRVPEGASMVGEHKFVGSGISDSFKLNLGTGQDFLGQFSISQAGGGDSASRLSWSPMNNARGYFISAMQGGGSADGGAEMVLWSSSDVAELGFGLIEYQTNSAIDGWIRERVVLNSSATQCSIPKGVFNGVAMVRAIAFGNESSFIYPPRPTDSRALAAWQPEWSAKVRVKSTFMSMLGGMAGATRGQANEREEKKEKAPDPVDLLRGLFRR